MVRTSGCSLYDYRPRSSGINTIPIDVSRDPLQENLATATYPLILKNIDGNEAELLPMARYSIAGRVVSWKHYLYLKWADKLAPIDIALAWGKLATHDFDNLISYDHDYRFYNFRFKPGFPLEQSYVISHSSNNHLIPATPTLEAALRSIRTDELIEIEGFLVNMRGPGNYHWNTSMTRDDTGGGACELIYVKELRIGNQKWE